MDVVDLNASIERVTAVKRIVLEVGELACAEPALLKKYLELALEDKFAQPAEVEILNIPVLARCKVCEAEFHLDEEIVACPVCNSVDIFYKKGKEMRIKYMDVIE